VVRSSCDGDRHLGNALHGMLAFHLPMPVGYYWPTVLLSLLLAIVASVGALYLVSRYNVPVFLYGAGWNYAGRRCRRLALCGHERHAHGCGASFRCPLVTVSILFAMAFSFAGLWLAFYFRDEPRKAVWRKIGGAGVMGAAVSGMHYTGMAAANYTPFQSSPKYV